MSNLEIDLNVGEIGKVVLDIDQSTRDSLGILRRTALGPLDVQPLALDVQPPAP